MSTSSNRALRRTKGQQSRVRLLEQATHLFGRYGYANVTMREIGAAAGLDNSTIYRYFAGKEELAAEVVLRALDELAPFTKPLDVPQSPSLQQLSDAVVAFSRHLWARPDLARLLLAWMTTTGEARSGFSYSIKLRDNPNHPAALLVGRLFAWLDRAQSFGAIRPIARLDSIVNILALAAMRPATADSFLHSLEGESDDATRQRTAEQELRAAITGAFAPAEQPR